MNIDRVCLLACLLLTAGAVGFAWVRMPVSADLLPALQIMPAWIVGSVVLAAILGFAHMALAGEQRPVARIRALVRERHREILPAFLLIVLAGLNLVAFMWIKPLLNIMVPFWADPMLADLDQMLFFGNEPWTLVQWLNFPASGMIYHPAWFLSIMIGLLLAIGAPSSPERSAILVSYFALWTIAAPLIHAMLPAAGPIFYEALGYGPRFADMPQHPQTRMVADYLWEFYASGSYGAGNGISAMPSMHVATSSWMVISVWVLARRWMPMALLAWLTIFGMSFALGWHYALDGIVGALAALGCYFTLRAMFRLGGREGISSLEPVPAE